MTPTLGTRVVVEARAKLNLGLAVGPRRDDGFHELATLFQSVSLADTLTLRKRRRGFSLRVRFEPAAARGRVARRDVPAGARNLALRAVRMLAARRGLRGGARLELVKRIPSRAGLGGGSADAAAAIAGLAALYGFRCPLGERLALAAELGSDVPFAVLGGTALGLGRGDRLTSLKLANPFRALIAVPSWGVETSAAFRRIDRRRIHLTAWRANLRSAQVLGQERLRADRAMQLGNTFESALGERRGSFAALQRRLEAAGVVSVRMTGSGSAVFGLLPHARAAAEAIRRYQGKEALYLVRSMGRGVKLIHRS